MVVAGAHSRAVPFRTICIGRILARANAKRPRCRNIAGAVAWINDHRPAGHGPSSSFVPWSAAEAARAAVVAAVVARAAPVVAHAPGFPAPDAAASGLGVAVTAVRVPRVVAPAAPAADRHVVVPFGPAADRSAGVPGWHAAAPLVVGAAPAPDRLAGAPARPVAAAAAHAADRLAGGPARLAVAPAVHAHSRCAGGFALRAVAPVRFVRAAAAVARASARRSAWRAPVPALDFAPLVSVRARHCGWPAPLAGVLAPHAAGSAPRVAPSDCSRVADEQIVRKAARPNAAVRVAVSSRFRRD